jgi:hypothetical protein
MSEEKSEVLIYDVKHALTQGIVEVRCVFNGFYYTGGYATFYSHGQGKTWFTDRQGAVYRAEDMRRRKMQSLANQLDRLAAMRFE